MPIHHDANDRDYLMNRRGVKSLITAFSKTMDLLEKDGHGLTYLSYIRNNAQERGLWITQFDEFYERWSIVFSTEYASENKRRCAIRDMGLLCLGHIKNDLRNDMWTDKGMQSNPEPVRFEQLFWTQIHQKMKYTPIMIACSVSRERAIRMTKMDMARREILNSARHSPITERALFEEIAVRIDKNWASAEKISEDLPLFLTARGSNKESLVSLDELVF